MCSVKVVFTPTVPESITKDLVELTVFTRFKAACHTRIKHPVFAIHIHATLFWLAILEYKCDFSE